MRSNPNFLGFEVLEGENPVRDGFFEMKNNKRVVKIKNSKIVNSFFKTILDTDEGELIIYTIHENLPQPGSIVVSYNNQTFQEGKITLFQNSNNFKNVIVENGTIVKVNVKWPLIFYIIIIIVILSFLGSFVFGDAFILERL